MNEKNKWIVGIFFGIVILGGLFTLPRNDVLGGVNDANKVFCTDKYYVDVLTPTIIYENTSLTGGTQAIYTIMPLSIDRFTCINNVIYFTQGNNIHSMIVGSETIGFVGYIDGNKSCTYKVVILPDGSLEKNPDGSYRMVKGDCPDSTPFPQ